MKSYSSDLRHRVIEAYTSGEGSIRKVAERFSVHWRTVSNWVTHFDKTNSMEPKEQRHGPLPKLNANGTDMLKELVSGKPDATLLELSTKFEEKTGTPISISTVWRALRRFGLTRKKKTSSASEADTP